jgi:Fic family protein
MESSMSTHRAGRLRTEQNWIGGNDYNPCGADFVPPPPEHVESLLEDLCVAVNDDVLSPLVQAALVHAQFETIHPFDDGNGRTGRALIHVVLCRRGVAPSYVPPISVALAASRDRYIRGLTDFRQNRIESWLEHFAGAAARSAWLASRYLASVEGRMEEWRTRLRQSADSPRADAAAWAVIDILPGHPVLNIAVAQAATGRSRPQIYRAFDQLEKAEVLLPLSAARRSRSWEANGLLDLLEGLNAGEPPPEDPPPS